MNNQFFSCLIALTVTLVASPAQANVRANVKANDLFYDNCSHATNEVQGLYLLTASGRFSGLTCEDLKSLTKGAQIIEMTLYPATLALTLSPMKAELMATLAELGLTMANPAVLGVTILGATGVVVVYLVLKADMDECERMEQVELKASILREVELKYGVDGRGIPLRKKR